MAFENPCVCYVNVTLVNLFYLSWLVYFSIYADVSEATTCPLWYVLVHVSMRGKEERGPTPSWGLGILLTAAGGDRG